MIGATEPCLMPLCLTGGVEQREPWRPGIAPRGTADGLDLIPEAAVHGAIGGHISQTAEGWVRDIPGAPRWMPRPG